jgi:hypothetical protein
MAAVDPVRLRFQIDALIASFTAPPVFHRGLIDLFNQYANRTLRFGESPKALPLIPMYHLPAPVMRQLELDLKPVIQADPESALAVADELWQDEYYEVRQVSILLLSNLPLAAPTPIIDRLEQWLEPGLDGILVSELLSRGTTSLQSTFPEAWENFISSLFEKENLKMTAMGLKALNQSVSTPAFENMPAVFRLISPSIREPQPAFEKDLRSLLTTLIDKTPSETAYFLQQAASISDSPNLRRLIKQCLAHFPEDLQSALKTILRN